MSLLQYSGSYGVDRIVQFRVRPGADLLDAIAEGVRREGIRAGVIISGIGALRRAVCRNLRRFPQAYPVTPEDRLYLEVEQPLELVSLGGWIAPKDDSEVEIHAHFAASTVEGDRVVTVGGHLTAGTVCGIKVVVAIAVLPEAGIRAAMDPDTASPDIFFRG